MRPWIVMANEGTYPFMGGGVSTWCHQLCSGLESVDFTILAVTGDTHTKYKYERQDSVKRVVHVPLWPGEEPAIYLNPGRYSTVLWRRWNTTSGALSKAFLKPFRTLLEEIFLGGTPIDRLVDAIVEVGLFFRENDFKAAMRSREVWEMFLEFAERFHESPAGRDSPPPTIADVTTCGRWFYNMLMPIGMHVPDGTVFHATIAASCALPGIVRRKVDGTSFVVTDHGVYLRERYINISQGDFSQIQKKFLIGLAILLGRACYAVADVVSPVAAFNSRWEIPWGAAKERIRIIYNGVDTECFRPSPKPEHRQGRPTVVAAARVFPLKDVETMIRGADVARKIMPEIHVICYGSLKADPPYVQKCRDLIEELGCGDNFEFGGFHPDPYGIFIEGDISVLSSISEGFPYTVLEAMSSGVACVATDVGGVREAVGDTGIVVPPRDPQALGEALAELLSDPDRRKRCCRAARERVVSEFTIQKQLKGYEDLYFEMHEDTLARQQRAA
ncbi:MAG: GT4 family glycosyltransferase PelF [Myxococcota bacterium]